MGFHTSHHYYALCDHYEGSQRCETSLVPVAPSEASSPHVVLVARGEAFNAAKAAGWEVTYDGTEDTVLCPQHRRTLLASTRGAGTQRAVVDVPLFELSA